MANWVRFADTKATILSAGLGVALTMLMANSRTVAQAIKEGCAAAWSVGALSALAGLALLWTLGCLVAAIGPSRRVTYPHLNRFAWPSLIGANAADLAAHAESVRLQADAWQQVTDLARLAEKKFGACGRAVWGFAAFVVLGVSCVVVSVWITA